jgi:uncharacterized repeat protein (TIGR01451 family)
MSPRGAVVAGCAALLIGLAAPAGAAALPSVTVGAVTTPLTNTTQHTGVTVTAGCPSSAMVGGGSYLRNASNPATLPTNGLVLGGQAPSSGVTPVDVGVGNGAVDPTDWFTDANFTGVADAAGLDQAETFVLCATGGTTHTVVATGSTAGAANNANQEVSPPVPATATCPSTTQLIGGGAATTTPDQVNDGTTAGNSGNLKPLASYPSNASGVAATNGSTGATSWSGYGASGIQNDGGGADVVTAYALCSTDPSPPPVEVARVDVPGPVAQPGTTTTTGSASCPSATQLIGGGFAADETVGATAGLEPQQGYHMRGSYPSTSAAASPGATPPSEVANGTSNPETWTDLLQLGGQTLPAGDFGVLHVYAMCARSAAPPGTADLSVSLSGTPDPVVVGQQLTYSMGVANAGPAAATDVVASEVLPVGVTFVAATPTTGTCAQAAGVVTCSIGGLGSGASASVSVVVTPTQPGSVGASASVSGAQPDANSANNSASATTTANLATRASPTLAAQPTGATLGGAISDQVTLAGGSSPTGAITFNVYGPGDTTCTIALASSSATVNGNGPYRSAPFTPTMAGAYHWIAAYGGDGANAPVGPQACGDVSQAVSVKVVPTLTTQALGRAAVGDLIAGQATLAGGAVVTGSITLTLYGPGDTSCTHALSSTTATVSGNGIYGSHPFTTATPGIYRWVASYSGDALNAPVGPTACAAPGSTITVTGGGVNAPASAAVNLFAAATPRVLSGGRISLVVTSPGRGLFRAVASVRVALAGGKSASVRYGARALEAGKAGRLVLVITPSAKAKVLRAHHTRLTVALATTFTPTGGKPRTRTSHVTVKGLKKAGVTATGKPKG